jgi:regulator of sirC expression with transglutaminase-like and TPR domain
MASHEDLMLLAHLVRRPDKDVDLEASALLLAGMEYPDLDAAPYLAQLEAWGAVALRRVRRIGRLVDRERATAALVTVLRFMYEDLGFHGNTDDYYDPRNSFLNEVLDRRTGIPISLAVVLLGLCRRAGVPAQGISFPSHFLVRAPQPLGHPVIVDPFMGRVLTPGMLEAFYTHVTGDEGPLDPALLEPASSRQILACMLNNLRVLYENQGDADRVRGVVDRLRVLSPAEASELAARDHSNMN